MSDFSRKILGTVAMTMTVAGFAMTASAQETAWQKAHPRRVEVNQRLDKQRKAINQDVKNGTLTKQQAAALHKDDRQVRQEERDMAHQNGGHLTQTEQKALNQQETAIHNEIPPK